MKEQNGRESMRRLKPTVGCNASQTRRNAQLNPICHLLALLGAHRILHVSRIRVNLILVVKIW